ncbi:MAG: hypothetical protein JWR54_724 [Mucilaginibacter sp.]|nr:hypothetical protein [Mucilaginibacter sp.]
MVAKIVGKQIAKRVGTAVVGRALGRLVPYARWGLTLYDMITSDFVADMQKENERHADDMMWHLK